MHDERWDGNYRCIIGLLQWITLVVGLIFVRDGNNHGKCVCGMDHKFGTFYGFGKKSIIVIGISMACPFC